MSLKAYLFFMSVATIIAAFSLAIVLATIDPSATNWLGFSLFYSALFLTIAGVFSIIGFIIRFAILHQRLGTRAVVVSFRQACLAAFLIVAVLLLLSQGLFSWLNVLLLIIGFSALEFFLLSLSFNNH